ncbi:Mucin-16, partial [Struthio camelus australis]
FTMNFTITNLPYSSSLRNPNSAKFSATGRVLIALLDQLFKMTSIHSVYTGCKMMAFRATQKSEDTGVDAVCTYKRDPAAPQFDRVRVYHEVSNKTNGITNLGIYKLDQESLYINGKVLLSTHNKFCAFFAAASPALPLARTERFTVNFTIINLLYRPELGNPNSKKFNATKNTLTYLVDPLLQKSSIGPAYIGCNGMAFRSVKNRDDTRVDAICSYRDEPSDPTFNRVTVYHELSNMTNGITKLGHYNLNSQSLYVNVMKPSTTQSPGPTTEQFTLNFTITNLRFTTDLATPNSAKFNSTEKIMQSYIDRLLQRSSTGPDFTGCKVIAFRSVRNRDNTGVDTICNYGSGSQVPKFDRAKVYQELRSMTSGFTKLGVYNLDNNSLYINGYNGPPERARKCFVTHSSESYQRTLSSTTAPSPTSRHFTLNFTLTNLPYTADLDVPSTYKFISTEKIIKHYLDPLFKRGSISPVYTGCRVMRFRSVKDRDDTGVDAVCSYKNNISIASFDREKVYHELSTMTKGVTKLGHYSLEKNSLYVNGKHLKPVLTEAPAILGYNFSFRIINENLTNSDSQSPEYKAAVESISNKMNQLYHQSNLQDHFLNCSVTRLRPGSIVVDCKCFFQPEPSINRAAVERAFQDGISHATGLRLGSSYQLQGFSVDSLELAIEAATHRTPLQSEKESFRLNFSITNLHYSPALQDTKSQLSKVNKQKIEKELDVFRTSSLKDYFVGCTVESFGPVLGKAYTSVASICKFTLHPSSRALQREVVYEELKHLTQGFTKLGPSYQLDEHSLGVDGYSPLKTAEQERSELPFWAIILICLFTLLGFILLLLLCFLIVFCLRRKSNLYQVQQSMYGVYFPHLNTR